MAFFKGDKMETVSLKVTSAFVVGGKIAKKGDVVEVSNADAKDLLNRGKAVLAEAKKAKSEPEKPKELKPEEKGEAKKAEADKK